MALACQPDMDLGLEGKACIVTGATRGIGLATATLLRGEGARVLLVARDAAEAARRRGGARRRVRRRGRHRGRRRERIVDACAERFGAVDVLVNNAGTSFVRPLDELTDEDWQGQWELNVMGPMRLMRAAAPRMARRRAAGGSSTSARRRASARR